MASLSNFISKKRKTEDSSGGGNATTKSINNNNPFLKRPVKPEDAIRIFLTQARTAGRSKIPPGTSFPITESLMEIEARIGILVSPYGVNDMRVLPSGPKRVQFQGRTGVATAFLCSDTAHENGNNGGGVVKARFEGGVTRSHFADRTGAGVSEHSSLSRAFGISNDKGGGTNSNAVLRNEIREHDYIETVYAGYRDSSRLCFLGDHQLHNRNRSVKEPSGKMERKEKIATMDLALPAAKYDLRLNLSSERTVDANVPPSTLPNGWSSRRLKRRRSYSKRDGSFAWLLDVTEVEVSGNNASSSNANASTQTIYEIEMELDKKNTLRLFNENDPTAAVALCREFSSQLWWALGWINPQSDVLEVDEFLEDHPDLEALTQARAHLGSLKSFIDSGRRGGNEQRWISPLAEQTRVSNSKSSIFKFPGCMPVNFSRIDIETVQRAGDKGYFLSEKTDGVRHLLVFLGNTAVLVDRTMAGKRPKSSSSDGSNKNKDKTAMNRLKKNDSDDPLGYLASIVQPGTVLDGEVVVHRGLRRPIFVVFDVLSISTKDAVCHLPFSDRLEHLRRGTFQRKASSTVSLENGNKDNGSSGRGYKYVDPFENAAVSDLNVPMPLLRKGFVERTDLDGLLSRVTEDRGGRTYRNGPSHHHLTDGIVFQPNTPYVCGTDTRLLKWKYLDTVTIDVEIGPSSGGGGINGIADNAVSVCVMGNEGTDVDMSRYVHLPSSEKLRLEADRNESGARIAEVGFNPGTGEWYYLTMRPDKTSSNHISTVLGTMLELAEGVDTEELRYRMSVPLGSRDAYRKETGKMMKQLLSHQRDTNRRLARGARK